MSSVQLARVRGQECPRHTVFHTNKKDSPEPPRLSLKTLPVRRAT
jgi:hypothetical protein